jgi:superfamily II DNA or RNA helicase
MATKTLYEHQDDTVQDVVQSTDDVLIEKPTGSGKTIEATAIASLSVSAGKRVVVATTQEHVEDAFTKRDYDVLFRPSGEAIPCPSNLIRAARDGAEGSVQEIEAYLAAAEFPGYALACTHAAICRVDPLANVPYPLLGALLVVDESHHAPAVRLSQVVRRWKAAGGRVVFLTATGFRSDGDPVLLDQMRVIRRTLAQHMEEGFAPGKVGHEIVAVRAERVSVAEFAGEEVPPEHLQDRLVSEMVAAWTKHRPKTVIRVPILKGGSGGMVEKVVAAFRAEGARVLDVSGQLPADKARFLGALPTERAASHYDSSKFDVLVGVQRVTEGMDWPLCSTVYVVGLPQSLVTVTQLLGGRPGTSGSSAATRRPRPGGR